MLLPLEKEYGCESGGANLLVNCEKEKSVGNTF